MVSADEAEGGCKAFDSLASFGVESGFGASVI